MLDTTKEALARIQKELDKRGMKFHSLVGCGIITEGEYRYLMMERAGEKYSPKFETMVKICNYFEITLNDLLPRYNKYKKSKLPTSTRQLLEICNKCPADKKEEIARLLEECKAGRKEAYKKYDYFIDDDGKMDRDYFLDAFIAEDAES